MAYVKYDRNNQILIAIIILIILIVIVIGFIIWGIVTDIPEPTTNECSTDNDCLNNFVCSDGTCVAECQFNTDCPDRWTCNNNRCTPECELDSECLTGWSCLNGTCTPECTVDSDCDPNQTCNGGICQSSTTGCEGLSSPNLSGTPVGNSQIRVTWDLVPSAVSYTIYLGISQNFPIGSAVQQVTILDPDNEYVFMGLSPGTYYIKATSASLTCFATQPSDEIVVVIP